MAVRPADISVIIPVAEGETAHEELLPALQNYEFEIIVSSEGSRAKSLNMGAAKAARKFLWFLHADSRPVKGSLDKLLEALERRPASLHYFDLEFSKDGPDMMALNQWGANFRSRILGLPFGDQGFCIRKDLFFSVGGFPEDAKHGEDHLFVWHARRHKIHALPVGAKLVTSARKYRDNGWLKTTLMHQKIWVGQAIPQWIHVLKGT